MVRWTSATAIQPNSHLTTAVRGGHQLQPCSHIDIPLKQDSVDIRWRHAAIQPSNYSRKGWTSATAIHPSYYIKNTLMQTYSPPTTAGESGHYLQPYSHPTTAVLGGHQIQPYSQVAITLQQDRVNISSDLQKVIVFKWPRYERKWINLKRTHKLANEMLKHININVPELQKVRFIML